jgi:acetylornithine deacetylase/succinyl-diaminopimelate desuccinylase-like protein
VSLRLVPKQTEKKVQKLLLAAVKKLAPKYADVKVTFVHGADPSLVDVNARPMELMSQAFKEVEGRGVVPVRSGGSIPIVPELGKTGAPVILSGIGLPDDRLHAPDEKISLEQVWKGVRVFARFFELMGA